MIVIDNFLPRFDELKRFSLGCKFKDEVNPIDGVVYPHICKDIPDSIVRDVLHQIHKALGRNAEQWLCFLRMSPKNVSVPHKFHNDNSMGRYSLMLYLEDRDDAGTGFAVHLPTGCHEAPTSEHQLNQTINDCNDDSKWQIYNFAKMKQNRAVIFDSQLFHVALPIGGFGEAREDSRIVFTCFFS